MSIRRSARRVSYTQIDNAVFAPGLSFRAMGLLTFLLSKPDHWEVSVAHLVNFSADSARPDGRDSIYSMIDELLSAGFMRRERARGDGGKMAGYDYEVFDSPQPRQDQPSSDHPCTAQPYTVKPTQVITDSEVKTDVEVTTEVAPAKRKKSEPRAESLPDWLPKDAWDDFVAMRAAMGPTGKLTARAAELVVSKLGKMRDAGQDVRAVLEQSVLNSWRGIWEVKPQTMQSVSRTTFAKQRQDAEIAAFVNDSPAADPNVIEMEVVHARIR